MLAPANPTVPPTSLSSICKSVVIVTVPDASAAVASAIAKPLMPGVILDIGFTTFGPILLTVDSIIATGVILLKRTCFWSTTCSLTHTTNLLSIIASLIAM